MIQKVHGNSGAEDRKAKGLPPVKKTCIFTRGVYIARDGDDGNRGREGRA